MEAHWCREGVDTSFKFFYMGFFSVPSYAHPFPFCTLQVIVSLLAVAAFALVALPALVHYAGWWGLVKYWLMPWLGYHFWMSTFTVSPVLTWVANSKTMHQQICGSCGARTSSVIMGGDSCRQMQATGFQGFLLASAVSLCSHVKMTLGAAGGPQKQMARVLPIL